MYLNSGKTEDAFVAACARNVRLAAALFNVQLLYKHVPGKQNTAADLLFRWRNTQSQMRALLDLIPNPLWIVTSPDLLEINNDI